MKNLFTSTLLLAGALALAPVSSVLATDLVVAQGGAGGAYATLTAAVAAAADGDRIMVKASATPFSESLIITKTLTFLCNDDGGRFSASGDWTFSPTGAARTLTIIGLDLISGSIKQVGNSPTTGRSKVLVLNSILRSGSINFDANNYDLTAAADSIIGGISFRFGKVIGNFIDNTAGNSVSSYYNIQISADGTASTDSVWVVANKVKLYNYYSYGGLYANTNSQYLYCVNNLFFNPQNNERPFGISAGQLKTGASNNVIANNTCATNYYFYYGSIYLTTPPANLLLANNLSIAATSYNGIVQASGGSSTYSLVYNLSKNAPFTVTVPLGTTNSATSNTVLNATTYAPNGGSDAINGGDPDAAYTDLDLSRNDVGAYGGSFSLANFHPFTNGGGRARVYLMLAPRRILQGGSVGVKATGFDR